jgi:hypothetical protein
MIQFFQKLDNHVKRDGRHPFKKIQKKRARATNPNSMIDLHQELGIGVQINTCA